MGRRKSAKAEVNFEEVKEFNELLSVSYFEKSYMGYHDDGEK